MMYGSNSEKLGSHIHVKYFASRKPNSHFPDEKASYLLEIWAQSLCYLKDELASSCHLSLVTSLQWSHKHLIEALSMHTRWLLQQLTSHDKQGIFGHSFCFKMTRPHDYTMFSSLPGASCNLFCKYWVLKQSALVLEMQLLHANIFIVINNRHALISAPAAASDIDLKQAEGIANEVSWITQGTSFVLEPVLLYMHEINSPSKPWYRSFKRKGRTMNVVAGEIGRWASTNFQKTDVLHRQ